MDSLATSSPPTAIIIEDEPQIRRFVRTALQSEGWQVFEAQTLAQGLSQTGTRKPELVILDLGLPDGDGIELIRDLRSWSSVAIIVLSARTEETEKVKALDAGADDYLTKPFGVAELLARIRANQRRQIAIAKLESSEFKFGTVRVDLTARLVYRQETLVHLTPIEYRLLTVLIANVGRVLTHRTLLQKVWGPNHSERSHYLRVFMSHLRQKLELDPNQPLHILTETGVGYRLVP
ncbi:MAG: two-component system response regulator KdpE [Burkholderiaceae bacterium]|nr:two-component system response regulator KdpE [Burkholderiaceae bacterium]